MSARILTRSPRGRSQRGAVLVELVIVLPILLALVLGLTTGSRYA